MERTTKRLLSISWTGSKASNLEEQWSVMAWESLPGTTNSSGGCTLPAAGGPWDTPIANTRLPSTSFSVACTEWCWEAALSELSSGLYIFMLHPLTSHPRADSPHRTQKQINVEKVILWSLGEEIFPPSVKLKEVAGERKPTAAARIKRQLFEPNLIFYFQQPKKPSVN